MVACCVLGCDYIPLLKGIQFDCRKSKMSGPTYKELIELLDEVESLDLGPSRSTAEVLTSRFCDAPINDKPPPPGAGWGNCPLTSDLSPPHGALQQWPFPHHSPTPTPGRFFLQ